MLDALAACGGNTSCNSSDNALHYNYDRILLSILPALTVVGNVMVVLGILKEGMLKTNANYFVLSLAVADINVGLLVMPAAIYLEVNNGEWWMGNLSCDIFVACDVLFSTASILNLTAICIDRFVAVTFPIEYAKQMTKTHIVLVVLVTWIVSIGIAIPVVCGLNRLERDADGDLLQDTLCTLRNPEYIIASSLGSFILPTCIVIPLYVKIFSVIRKHSVAAQTTRKRKTVIPLLAPKINRIDARRAIEATKYAGAPKLRVNDVTVSPDQSYASARAPVRSISLVEVPNGRAFFEIKVYEQKVASCDSRSAQNSSDDSQPAPGPSQGRNRCKSEVQLPANANKVHSPFLLTQVFRGLWSKNSSLTKWPAQRSGAARAMRRETKATLTLAIVLFVFLACWMPFFIVNLLNAFCIKTHCALIEPSVLTVFVWLGYVNSALNPIIYGLFNTEFRKAFKKLLCPLNRTPAAPHCERRRDLYFARKQEFRQSSRI